MIAAAIVALAVLLRPHAHASVERTPPARADVAKAIAVQRAPEWGPQAQRDLQSALRTALAPAISGARDWSCAVISQGGRVLFDDGAQRAVEPASAQKLIVADAAIDDLGTDYRFVTFLAAAKPPSNGTIGGDLWLAGSGDPSLRSGDLRSAVAALRKNGIDAVSGSLVVDPSAIAGEEINPLWNADDSNEDFMAATSGISIDEDTVEFDVTGGEPGALARVELNPRAPAVTYSGSVETGDGDDVVIAGTAQPNQFRVYGTIPPGVRERFWVPVHGIPQYAAGVVDELLRSGGVGLEQKPQTGTVPLDAQILWEHRSQPLVQLLHHMLIFSDNHYAEQLMRTVGGTSGDVADDQTGLAAERSVLKSQTIPTPGLHLVDGSGLAHANRVAAITLAGILARFEAQPRGNVLYPLLPRGGIDGTLKMYHFVSAAGRVRAKSGHLDDAASLAGYVDTRKHGRVVFAFMINGSPGDPDAAIVSAVDRIAER